MVGKQLLAISLPTTLKTAFCDVLFHRYRMFSLMTSEAWGLNRMGICHKRNLTLAGYLHARE